MGLLDFLRPREKGYIIISEPLDQKEFERIVERWRTEHPEIIWTTDEGMPEVLNEIVEREHNDR